MKKILSLVLVFSVLATLCLYGCVTDPATYYFDADDIINNATKIQLVFFENKEPTNINIEKDIISSLDMNNIEIIETLETKNIDDFANELSTITFHVGTKSVNSPVGYAVIIHMKNQEMIVLSCTVISGIAYGMVAVFLNDGTFVRHIAQFADEPKFNMLLHNFFDL